MTDVKPLHYPPDALADELVCQIVHREAEIEQLKDELEAQRRVIVCLRVELGEEEAAA